MKDFDCNSGAGKLKIAPFELYEDQVSRTIMLRQFLATVPILILSETTLL
jgi:hypothetical protein